MVALFSKCSGIEGWVGSGEVLWPELGWDEGELPWQPEGWGGPQTTAVCC